MITDTCCCFVCFTEMLRAQTDCRAGFGPTSTPLTSCSLKGRLCFANTIRQCVGLLSLSRVSLVYALSAQGSSVVQFVSLKVCIRLT
jgi:hypothetical protein